MGDVRPLLESLELDSRLFGVPTLLGSPPELRTLWNERDKKKVSAIGFYRLLVLALDHIRAESRPGRRKAVASHFVRSALRLARREAGAEFAATFEELLKEQPPSSSGLLPDRRTRRSRPLRARRRLQKEYEREYGKLVKIIPRQDSARYRDRERTARKIQDLYPELPDARALEMAQAEPYEATQIILGHRHGLSPTTVRDRLTRERRIRRRTEGGGASPCLINLDWERRPPGQGRREEPA